MFSSIKKFNASLYFLWIFIPVQLISLGTMAENYVKLSQFNTENGLNQNSILGIMQDNDGYLWISTSEGINRYDGYRMSSLYSPNSILKSNSIEEFFQDSTGLIWIGAAPEHNYVLDKRNQTLTPIKLKAPNDYDLEYAVFNNIIEDEHQDLWIATYREIYFFDRSTGKYEFILPLTELYADPDKKHFIRDILLVDQILLIATSSGLYSLNLQTNQVSHINHTPLPMSLDDQISEDQNNVKKLHLNKSGQLMIGTVEGLYRIDAKDLLLAGSEFLAELVTADLNIWQIIEKPDFYWLATDKGLFKLTEQFSLEFMFRFSELPFNTSDDDIGTMVEDREGNLWLGSRTDGLFKWHPNMAIKKHLRKNGAIDSRLSNDLVLNINQTSENVIWIATANGLTKLDKKQWKTTNYLVDSDEKQVVSGSTIYSVTKNLGKLWLNTYEGIQVYDEKTLAQEHIIFPETKNKIFSERAYQLFFLSQDSLAIVTRFGIYDYSISKNTVTLMESTKNNGDDSLNLYEFYSVATGSGDSYFVAGTDRLWKYSRESHELSVFHQLPKTGSHNSYAGDLYRDGDSLWITYPNYGIYHLNAETGKELQFISEKNIGANSIMDIFPDKKGNLWFTSNDGLLRLNKSTSQVTKYGRSDGLITNEFSEGAKLQLDTGLIMLGSIKGVTLIDLNLMGNDAASDFGIRISDVSLLSQPVKRSPYSYSNEIAIELSHDDFGLKLEFSALLLDKPNQVKYRYWIDGDNSSIKTTIEESELFFPKFETGVNRLFISAIDYRNGIESVPVSIKIVTRPPPWRSTTAIAGYFFFFVLLFSLGYRRNSLKQQAKELIFKKIRHSEERLSLALKGGNSGLWDWHAKDNTVYDPRLSYEESSNEEKTVTFKERLSAIHYRDQNNVLSIWRDFLRGESKVFDVIYRMKKDDKKWQWYRDIAMVSEFNEKNDPQRVTGTYTDITEKQEATERVGLFSKALENARDIIVILNKRKKIIAANRAFQIVSNYTLENVMDCGLDYFIHSPNNKLFISDIFAEISQQEHWEGDAEIVTENGSKIPVLISATTFFGNDYELYYVFSMSDISKQKKAEIELKKLVYYDALTGLPNRNLLLDRIVHAIKHAKRFNQQLAVFFVDLDRFKQINDTLGHDIGDLLLIELSNVLSVSIREDDTVARIGGDEFVVMLEGIEGVTSINRIAQNILHEMKQPIILKGNRVTISASIGISIYPQDASNAATLLKHADIAMYHAKGGGRNNFKYFEGYMNRAAKHRLEIENKLRHAVEQNEFHLEYQPQFDMLSGKLKGVEALARWRTQSGELIPPSTFIPIAEEIGLIIPITEKLLPQALENISKWNAQGRYMTLAFNLSAIHIYDKEFIEFVESLLNKYPSVVKFLEFELTESLLMKDIEKARKIFDRLDDMGINLALDDFGTGYSSLKYLSQLPINKLKIDMSFVSKIGTSVENDAIVRTIISLAKYLNQETVAEGIETREQFEFLKKLGVNYAQGYLFSKPLEVKSLEKILDHNIFDQPTN